MNPMGVLSRCFTSASQVLRATPWKSNIIIATILFGSAGIATTYSISQNIDTYIEKMMESNGGAKVEFNTYAVNSVFQKKDLDGFKNISVIKHAYLNDQTQVLLRAKNKTTRINLTPVNKENSNQFRLDIKRGHWISTLDRESAAANIVLSSAVLQRLDKTLTVGDLVTLKINGGHEVYLRLIGIADLEEPTSDYGIGYVNASNYTAITGRKDFSKLSIVATEINWMIWVEKLGLTAFRDKFGSNIFVNNAFKSISKRKAQLHIFMQMGYILGFIALLAGAIGSTSLMVLNIGLRRREIGLYQAMGYSRLIILAQFTCETLILSFIGGLIGGFLGCVVGFFISQHVFGVSHFFMNGTVLGLGTALAVGLVFGLVPALLAARMDPVKALHG